MAEDKENRRSREELLAKVERYTEVPMLILVIVIIVTLVIPMVVALPEATHQLFELIDWFIWAAFALELLVKTYLSRNRLLYLRTHPFDVLIVVLPLLRIFRIFRIARALRIFRLLRILTFFVKFTAEIKTIFSRHGFNYLFIVFLGLIGLGSVITYSFDQNAETGASSLGKSLWLTVVNAFSGGYANVYPETSGAKAFSIFLIVIGTVLVSYFTASLASYFTEKEQDVEQERIDQKLDALMKEVNTIKQKLSKS